MIRSTIRRLSTGTLLALALITGGLPVLTGTAHAATITPTPNTVPNDGPQTFTVANASLPLLASSATLTKSDDSSIRFSGTIEKSASSVKATFQLVNAYPGQYNLRINEGVTTDSCTRCITVTGLPPALSLSVPSRLYPGDPDAATGSVALTNPSRGEKFSSGRIQLTFSSVAGLQPAQLRVYDATDPSNPQLISLTSSGADLIGYLGAPSGFTVDHGYAKTTPLRFFLTTGAPSGTLSVVADFGPVASDGTLINSAASAAGSIVLSSIAKGSLYHPVTPARLLDTRQPGKGPLAANEARVLDLSTLPSGQDATGVVVNIAAFGSSEFGTITVYPEATNPNKGEGNVAYRPTRTVSNLVTTAVSADHKILLRNNGTSAVQVVVDVEGYYTNKNSLGGSRFVSLAPKRVLDTRATGAVPSAGTVVVDNLSTAGVPATATAVAATIFVLSPTASGHVPAYPKGTALPNATNVTFAAGHDVAQLAVVKLGGSPAGITLRNSSAGSVQLAVDVVGYFSDTGVVIRPGRITRIIDTRDGTGTTKAPLPGSSNRSIPIVGKGGVPTGATLVQLNVTVVNPQSSGYFKVYPGDVTSSASGSVSYVTGENIASVVWVRLPANGVVNFTNTGSKPAELVVDVLGWGAAQ